MLVAYRRLAIAPKHRSFWFASRETGLPGVLAVKGIRAEAAAPSEGWIQSATRSERSNRFRTRTRWM